VNKWLKRRAKASSEAQEMGSVEAGGAMEAGRKRGGVVSSGAAAVEGNGVSIRVSANALAGQYGATWRMLVAGQAARASKRRLWLTKVTQTVAIKIITSKQWRKSRKLKYNGRKLKYRNIS
jgi:L-aminopeptidase/D-esterase-like protein